MLNRTGIKIITEEKRHLGASLGSDTFPEKYASDKVKNWCDEIERLSKFAKSYPQASCGAFIHEEMYNFTYFMRTIPPYKYIF